MESLKHEVRFYPAFDGRNPNPEKNYGIHGVEVKFMVFGEAGVLQFVIFTDWYLPSISMEDYLLEKEQKSRMSDLFPMAADLAFHSPKPQYEGHNSLDCELLGGKCYYDGSTLAAEPLLSLLIKEGSDPVWKELDRIYQERYQESLMQ